LNEEEKGTKEEEKEECIDGWRMRTRMAMKRC
jgi:hypothetical protein